MRNLGAVFALSLGGAAFIRAICKLTHVGPKQYAKGLFLQSHLLLPLVYLLSHLFRVLCQAMVLHFVISCLRSSQTLGIGALEGPNSVKGPTHPSLSQTLALTLPHPIPYPDPNPNPNPYPYPTHRKARLGVRSERRYIPTLRRHTTVHYRNACTRCKYTTGFNLGAA